MLAFGDYLIAWREYFGWTQEDTWMNSGVAVSTISRLESKYDKNGKEIKPGPGTRKKLAAAFKIEPQLLETNPPAKQPPQPPDPPKIEDIIHEPGATWRGEALDDDAIREIENFIEWVQSKRRNRTE
jgi:transcriptional regulator with XRE-family HTH domain